jgi:DUF2934 family protein
MARRSTEAVAIEQGFAALIAERAYFKAERRGFAPGFELDDWLAAEREVKSIAPAVTAKKTASRNKSASGKK